MSSARLRQIIVSQAATDPRVASNVRAVRQAWDAAVAGESLVTYAKHHPELAQSLAFFGGGKAT